MEHLKEDYYPVLVFDTHASFEFACEAFLQRYGGTQRRARITAEQWQINTGWQWREDEKSPGQGYLYREIIKTYPKYPNTAFERFENGERVQVRTNTTDTVLKIVHRVLLSPRYHVPTFLIQASDEDGSHLSLDNLFERRLVRLPVENHILLNDMKLVGRQMRTERGPVFLDVGHPVTKQPMWRVEPCLFADAVIKTLAQSDRNTVHDANTVEGGLEWIETWMSLINCAVDLRYRDLPV